jgi:hypothetical protein
VVSKLDKRAWLEVLDRKHRYAKNLRTYFQSWDLLGMPMGDFWRWLDEGAYELESCPRALLDRDTVHYCGPVEAEDYRVNILVSDGCDDGAIFVHAPSHPSKGGQPLETGPEGFIFVLRGGAFYAAPKRTQPPRFHHSSFFAGGPVEVAGMLVVRQGRLVRLLPHSGHYRPRDEHVRHLLRFVEAKGVDLGAIEVRGHGREQVEGDTGARATGLFVTRGPCFCAFRWTGSGLSRWPGSWRARVDA